MQIYVGKNSQQLGPFSLEEVNRKLADGTFVGTDLAWYEGAAGWAPLSSVAGVVVSRAPVSTPAPAPVPAPAPSATPVQPAVPVAPVRPNTPIVQRPGSNTRTLSIISWALLGVTFLISFVPIAGCGTSFFLGIPVALTAIVLGVIMLARGGTGAGILSIIGGVLIVPLCIAAASISILLFGGTVERKQQTQIKDNLLLIDSAKTKWVAETKATDGTPVTMASIKSQLGGKEVKPAVGETYDPMPVGQKPTATLPANTTLGNFSAGDVLTVASIETALANSSAFHWSVTRNTTVSTSPSSASTPLPAASPKPQASVSPKPQASVQPSVTASPKASVSPKSSVSPAPHSLISPRQSVEPEETPSSRTSPSAKFAPKNGPRTTPRQSPSDRDQSNGPRQGKPPPSESPSATPDDDDDN